VIARPNPVASDPSSQERPEVSRPSDLIFGQHMKSEHEEKLRSGVRVWNDWRKGHLWFADPDLSGIWFRGDISTIDLRDVDLSGVDFREVRLNGADLRDAKLDGANFEGADLTGCDLRGA